MTGKRNWKAETKPKYKKNIIIRRSAFLIFFFSNKIPNIQLTNSNVFHAIGVVWKLSINLILHIKLYVFRRFHVLLNHNKNIVIYINLNQFLFRYYYYTVFISNDWGDGHVIQNVMDTRDDNTSYLICWYECFKIWRCLKLMKISCKYTDTTFVLLIKNLVFIILILNLYQ